MRILLDIAQTCKSNKQRLAAMAMWERLRNESKRFVGKRIEREPNLLGLSELPDSENGMRDTRKRSSRGQISADAAPRDADRMEHSQSAQENKDDSVPL